MVLMIDNYDSFTYNLVQYFMELGKEVNVHRNDRITPEKAQEMDFDYLVISPGPSNPENAGCSIDMIKHFAGKKPILGVCLGHQSIGAAFGADIVSAEKIMHGKADLIKHDGKSIFSGLPNPLRVIRYHSLAIDKNTLSPDFEISAESEDGEIMAIRHKTLRIEGVQFHPESIGTEDGKKLLNNFLKGVKELPAVKSVLKKGLSGNNLSLDEASHLADLLTEGSLTGSQAGSFLTALAIKGETVDEITGFAKILREKAIKLNVPENIFPTDTCGTGGDESGTFNISTAAAFVSAGAGAFVAKHGNRSITSKSGSADVLEALGVKIDLPKEKSEEALQKIGICFLFAPLYHPAFKHVMGTRKELGFRTVFNILGPMINPAFVKSQVMGVFSPLLTEKIAKVLSVLGVEKGMVLHSNDGLDEISMSSGTKITEFREGWTRTYTFNPEDYGFELCSLKDLRGGNSKDNADIILRVLEGEQGPHRDVVVINAAASIYTSGLASDFKGAILLAQKSIDNGSALNKLKRLIEFGKHQ